MEFSRHFAATIGVATVICSFPIFAADAPSPQSLADALAKLPAHKYGESREFVTVIDDAIKASHADAGARKSLVAGLVGVLGGTCTDAAVDILCRRLSLIGGDAAVPALAVLLADVDRSHKALYALERIGTPAARESLRNALAKVADDLKPGIINSLGFLRDTDAVSLLVPLLRAEHVETATASVDALGEIGSVDAVRALLSLKREGCPDALRSSLGRACVRGSERLRSEGEMDLAYAACDAVAGIDEPAPVRIGAFRGLVLAKPGDSVPRLTEALVGENTHLRSVAADLVCELPADIANGKFADSLPSLSPTGRVALTRAFARRGDRTVRPTVVRLLSDEADAVRAAVVGALAALGTADDVAILASLAAAEKPESAEAERTLTCMSAPGVNEAMVGELVRADVRTRGILISVLGNRYAEEASPVLTKLLGDKDADTRKVAIEALGKVARASDAPFLVKAMCETTDRAERDTVQKALFELCSRYGSACASSLVDAFADAAEDLQCVFIPILRRAGGDAALDVVRDAARERQGDVKIAAIRELSEWGDRRAAVDLLELARNSEDLRIHVLSLRGYIKASVFGTGKESDRLKALQTAVGVCRRVDEKKQVLGEVGKIRSLAAVDMAVQLMAAPELTEEAASAAVSAAGSLRVKGKDAAKVAAAMDTVLASAKNEKTRKGAESLRAKYRK